MKNSLQVVLVRPSYAGNVGATLRLVANFDVDRLHIIAPECDLGGEFEWMMAGAKEFRSRIKTYSSWSDFNKANKQGVRIALSRRAGKRRRVQLLDQVIGDFVSRASNELVESQVFLVFGPEADGLSQEDIDQCNMTACLPVPGPFKSMNLSHAVLLGIFIAQQKMGLDVQAPVTKSISRFDHKEYFPEETIREWLEALGFNLSKRKRSAFVVMKRLLLQNWPTQYELHILESILRQNIRKLKSATLLKKVPNKLT